VVVHRSALDESLQRARRAAAGKPKGEDDIANEVIARRQQEDAALNQLPDVSEGAELDGHDRTMSLCATHTHNPIPPSCQCYTQRCS